MSESNEGNFHRWQPMRFEELVGQEPIKRELKNAIEGARIANAYLFSGPRGTGKTTTARLFACALNADGGSSFELNPESEMGCSIMKSQCMDVIEIDGSSYHSVDQIRDFRDDCIYAPANGRYKIYVIDEAHMLSNTAFDVLLKTLEQIPPHVVFILTTPEAGKVLPAIVSRCKQFEFGSIDAASIVVRLRQISQMDGIKTTEATIKAIARLSNGSMGKAQSILFQMISNFGSAFDEGDLEDLL